jgi:hypothetical protein
LLDPKLEILPPAQRALWNDLKQTPSTFVLYGGTAVALRLGHRQSIDFDFFSNDTFEPGTLLDSIVYLKEARIDLRGSNTLSVTVDRNGPVKLSFFGDVNMGSVEGPDISSDNHLQIASLLDLTATKLKTVQQRAEAKDYIDVASALSAGVSLADALGAAIAIYGKKFNAVAALKSLTYYQDGNLPSLPQTVRKALLEAAKQVNLESLPTKVAKPTIVRQDKSR